MHRVEQQHLLIEQTVYPYSRIIRKFIPSGEIPEVKPILVTTTQRHAVTINYHILRYKED